MYRYICMYRYIDIDRQTDRQIKIQIYTYKKYADDTSLFSKQQDFKKPGHELNKDFTIIKNYVFQLKMDFNLDLPKQATYQGFLFSQSSNQQSKTTFLRVFRLFGPQPSYPVLGHLPHKSFNQLNLLLFKVQSLR